MLVEVLLLVFVVSIDCFAAAITYGLAKIKVSLKSACVISVFGSVILSISLVIAEALCKALSPEFAQSVGGLLLVILGILMISKRLIKKYFKEKRRGFATIFLDETKADFDGSMDISVKEAFFLAGILSTDCFLTGLSAGLGLSKFQKIMAVGFNFLGGLVAIYLGLFFGKILSGKIKNIDLSVLDGGVLVMLGVMLMCHI